MGRKKKLTLKEFEKILKNNSKENPLNIDNYDKQSIIDCRLSKGSLFKFHIVFTCINCGKLYETSLYHKDRINKYSASLCKSCHSKKTFVKNYGVDCPFKSKKIRKKIEQTKEKRYGDKNFVNHEKARKTCLKKYGVENVNKLDSIKEKKKVTYTKHYGVDHFSKTNEFKEKRNKTLIKKHGSVEKAYELRNKKSEETNLKRYNVTSTNKLESVKEKKKLKSQEKYNTDTPLQADEVKKKIKQTNLERYHVENISQLPQVKKLVKEKARKTKLEKYGKLHFNHKYLFNNELFDSSWELAFYIYYLDKQHNIKHEPCNFSYTYNGEEHLYSVDFKVSNKYYEIKGNQFLTFYKNGNIKGMVCPYDHDKDDLYNTKYKCMKKHKVNVVSDKEITKYLDYIEETYGSLDHLEQYRIDKNDEEKE